MKLNELQVFILEARFLFSGLNEKQAEVWKNYLKTGRKLEILQKNVHGHFHLLTHPRFFKWNCTSNYPITWSLFSIELHRIKCCTFKRFNFQHYRQTKMSWIIVFWSNRKVKIPQNIVFRQESQNNVKPKNCSKNPH